MGAVVKKKVLVFIQNSDKREEVPVEGVLHACVSVCLNSSNQSNY